MAEQRHLCPSCGTPTPPPITAIGGLKIYACECVPPSSLSRMFFSDTPLPPPSAADDDVKLLALARMVAEAEEQ